VAGRRLQQVSESAFVPGCALAAGVAGAAGWPPFAAERSRRLRFGAAAAGGSDWPAFAEEGPACAFCDAGFCDAGALASCRGWSFLAVADATAMHPIAQQMRVRRTAQVSCKR